MFLIRLLPPGRRRQLARKDLLSLLPRPVVKLVKLEYLLQLQALHVLFFQLLLVFLDLSDD